MNRAVSTLIHCLHPLGGFSGGPSNTQTPHLLPTYAATSSLAIVGDDTPDGGWKALAKNRQATYDFFMRCKRPNGGFVVCEGGEVDVRSDDIPSIFGEADDQGDVLPLGGSYST